MKDPLELGIRRSSSRVGSPELSETPVLAGAGLKAQKVRESKKLSWVGYGELIKNRPGEDFGRSLSVSPSGASRSSRFPSPDISRAPSRGPSPIEAASQLRRPSPVDIRADISQESSDLYSFPKSKVHVRFSSSLPNLPVDTSGLRRASSLSPELQAGLASPLLFQDQRQRPSVVSLLTDQDKNSIFGAPQQVSPPEVQVTYTPRVPGDEGWRESLDDPVPVEDRLEKEGLLLQVPEFLTSLRGCSRDGEAGRPSLASRPSNLAGVLVAGSHRRSTFVRAVEAVTSLGATFLAPSTERRTSKYVTTAAKKNSTVIVPVNAKQWLLQSLRMQDWELRELFDQMEMIPQLAADHVREVRAEWESLEARSLSVPPEAELLLKDQHLLERTKALLRLFIKVVSEKGGLEEAQESLQEIPNISTGAASELAGANFTEQSDCEQTQKEREASVRSSSPWLNRGPFSPVQFPLKERSGSVLGRPICPACGKLDTSAPNTVIRGGVLPRESIYQERAPLIPNQSLPSFIPFEDYVIRQSIVKPSGKSDEFKTTYSPLDKRWYTVLFPALQPGKREDVALLSEWLLHAIQKNCVEDSGGHFTKLDMAFVLHSVAYLEIVRQVRIHCEERGDMMLHVWRQLLRIFNQTMSRAEPRIKAMEDDIGKYKEINDKNAAQIKLLTTNLEKTVKSLHDVEEKLKLSIIEIGKMRRCRLCLAGNMTPRSRENFVRRTMMKRYGGTGGSLGPSLFGGNIGASFIVSDGKEKSRQESADESGPESPIDLVKKIGESTSRMAVAPDSKTVSSESAGGGAIPVGAGGGAANNEGNAEKAPGAGQADRLKSSTVITFLRAALLKRSQRPTLDEAAKKQVADDIATLESIRETVEKETQTNTVEIKEPGEFSSVLKRSNSCPARMFWIEIMATPEQRAKHRWWMEEQGLVAPEGETADAKGEGTAEEDTDEVEIIVADKPIKELEEVVSAEGAGAGDAGDKGKRSSFGVHKLMKTKVNKLANDSLEALGAIGEQLNQMAGGGSDVALKVAALISKWKRVAKTTGPMSATTPSEGGFTDGMDGAGDAMGGVGTGGADDFEWEDYDGEGEEGDGRGRRRKRGRAPRRTSGTSADEASSSAGRSDSLTGTDRKRESSFGARGPKKSSKSSVQGFELGKLVPLGFAKMMNINSPPKAVKFFNERQLTKLVTAVYVAKIDADAVDDASDNERQSSCEFVYDFMLNLYGLKRLAEAAVWGLFKKIKQIYQQKKIDKAHKARMFYRFCGMDDGKYYSERDLYLYLRVLAKGMSKPGLFYPSGQDDGINYVNCVWIESFAEEPLLQEYLGSQASTLEFINAFVAAHAVPDKVSLEVKKITKSQNVKRIDFDEFMEAVLEKALLTALQAVSSVKKDKKEDKKPKEPLTLEKRQALENLFTAGDANQDGVLTFQEFREILRSADESISQQTALRIFRETLLLEPEGGDKISPLAFATVAHDHNIAAPPSVIYSLLKKTWLQIQGDINQNKIKEEEAKKESVDLRMKLARYVDEAKETTVDQAVQTFKEFILKFCGNEEELEETQEDDMEEEGESEEEGLERQDPSIPEGDEAEVEEPTD